MDDPVTTLRADTDHGSAWLSRFALDALRERAAAADEYDAVAALARDLRDARPSMHAVANRINRVMADAEARTPAAVAERAAAVREQAETADEAAAANAAAELDGPSVLTLSRSGTVLDALGRADLGRVSVLESRPGGEGSEAAERLARRDDAPTVTLAPDAAVADLLAAEPVDAVLVGADAVLSDGSVVNKVGTRTAATVAARAGVPLLAVCAAAKVAPAGTTDPDLEPRDPTALYDGSAAVAVHDRTFDRTPPALVAAVVTERGTLDAAGVRSVAETHAAMAAWDE